MMQKLVAFAVIAGGLGLLPVDAGAQAVDLNSAVALRQNIRAVPDIVYLRAGGWEGRLDVYAQNGQAPTPTVIFFHGGGWTQGNKETQMPNLLPWLAMGYSVVNVGYRLANVALAPAAVEDSRCALRWVHANAKEYGFDPSRLITTGQSAGAHLAMMAAMVPTRAGLDRQCLTAAEPRVAAVVNFYGITDVADLLDAPGKNPFPWPQNRPYAVWWLGNQPNREDVAKAASPLTYVRAGVPPVISVQGDADPTVPYSHSVRLHAALQQAGVPNEHVAIATAGHGNFTLAQWQDSFARIRAFLAKHGAGITSSP